MKHIPNHICHKIYDILVGHTGAPERERKGFVYYYGNPKNQYKPTEYRICYRWGMAGKFWWNNDRFYVSGGSKGEFASDNDFERECAEAEKVNVLLAPLFTEFVDATPAPEEHHGSLADQFGLPDSADFIKGVRGEIENDKS